MNRKQKKKQLQQLKQTSELYSKLIIQRNDLVTELQESVKKLNKKIDELKDKPYLEHLAIQIAKDFEFQRLYGNDPRIVEESEKRYRYEIAKALAERSDLYSVEDCGNYLVYRMSIENVGKKTDKRN